MAGARFWTRCECLLQSAGAHLQEITPKVWGGHSSILTSLSLGLGSVSSVYLEGMTKLTCGQGIRR